MLSIEKRHAQEQRTLQVREGTGNEKRKKEEGKVAESAVDMSFGGVFLRGDPRTHTSGGT